MNQFKNRNKAKCQQKQQTKRPKMETAEDPVRQKMRNIVALAKAMDVDRSKLQNMIFETLDEGSSPSSSPAPSFDQDDRDSGSDASDEQVDMEEEFRNWLQESKNRKEAGIV